MEVCIIFITQLNRYQMVFIWLAVTENSKLSDNITFSESPLLDSSSRSITSAPSHRRSLMSCTGFQIQSRIVFKQCLLVRSCLAGSAPSYLAELCIPVSSVTGRRQNLRSASRGIIVVPRVRTERYGRRGFNVSGPQLWNSLPPRIRSLIEKPDNSRENLNIS